MEDACRGARCSADIGSGWRCDDQLNPGSTNPLERLNKEVKRRADFVGIFPSEQSIIGLIGAVLLEAIDEWQLQHRYMSVEAMGELLSPSPTNETLQLPPRAA
jgi:transposase-like protein